MAARIKIEHEWIKRRRQAIQPASANAFQELEQRRIAMNDEKGKMSSDEQKAKAVADSAAAKHDGHTKKEDKHDAPVDKKVDKKHGHHA